MRIVIGEDETVLRDTLERLLSSAGHDVVGTAGDGPELVRQAQLGQPQVVIADVRMPPSRRDEGLRAARRIRARAPAPAILVISHHLQVRYALELVAVDARGVGYLLKQRLADVEQFLSALDHVGAGGTVIDAEVVAVLVGRLRGAALETDDFALLALIAQGRTDAAIAEELTLPESAVAARVARAFAALGLPAAGEGHERVSALVRRATQAAPGPAWPAI